MKGLSSSFNIRAKGAVCTALMLAALWLTTGNRAYAAIISSGSTSITIDPLAGMNSWTVGGVQQIASRAFYYRDGSMAQEYGLGNISATPYIGTFLGTRGLTLMYSNVDYAVTVSYQTSGGTTSSGVGESVRIFNYGSSALTFHLFQYVDFNLGGVAAGQSSSIESDGTGFTVAKQSYGTLASALQTISPGAQAAETQPVNATWAKLNDGSATTLDSTKLSAAGDVAWGLQWDYIIPAYASADLSLSTSLVVPEPTCVALGLLGLGAWLIRRRV